MRRSRIGLLAGIGLLGCAGSEARDGGFTVRDSAEVRIADNVEAMGSEPFRLSSEPTLQIGIREGDPEYLLGQVAHAVRRSDASIAVADGTASVIRVYDAAGTHLFTFGGPGDGPGEFRSIASLWRAPGDTLGVYDSRQRRITFVGPDGSLVREVIFAAQQPAVSALPLGDGSFIAMAPPPPPPPSEDRATDGRPDAAIVRYDGAGVLRDTVATVPGLQIQVIEIGGRPAIGLIPFGGNTYVGVRGDGLVVGTAERCEIRELRPDGTLLGLVRWPCDLAVSESDITEWKDHMRMRADLEEPGAVEMIRAFIEQSIFPQTRGAYGAFLVGEDGSVWLPEIPLPGNEPSRWTVLDADGRLQGTVTMPDRFVPLEIGTDYVLGRWSDELDVQYVRVYDRMDD